MDNGQGGTVGFAYQQIGQAASKLIFKNYRRVTGKTVADGRGNSYPWSYQYSSPMLNTLGTSVIPGDPNATSATPNSAALYLNYTWIPNSFGAVANHLLTQANESFLGHAWAKEVRPDGSWSEHWFRQGDAGCTPTATGGNIANYNNDSCFVLLREREFLRGKEYQVEQKAANGALLSRTESTFGVSFLDYTSPEIGVWRAWTFPLATYASAFEGGGTPTVKTTNYAYDASYQDGGVQHGNLTRTAEYAGDYRATGAGTPRVRLTERWFNTLVDASSNFLVRLPREELVRGATDGEVLARTDYFYDGYVTGGSVAFGVQSAGKLKLVRKFVNAGAATQGADMASEYDAYGNPTQAISYAGYAATQFAAPGGGSAARTTTTVYDPTFHAFPTSVTPPDPNGVGLTETATYDYRMGLITGVTDPNAATTNVEYDNFGRLLKLIKPGDSSTYPSSQIDYFDTQLPVRYRVGQRETTSPGDVRWTTFFYDGLGRQIQQQRETSTGAYTQVSDARYDGLGRATQQSVPYDLAVADATIPPYTAPGGGWPGRRRSTTGWGGRRARSTRPAR